jgi:rhodanese-related sulfurtransferase
VNPQRLSLRFPVASGPSDLEAAVRVFHRFIQRGLAEGLLLDVADYRHVPRGPGVLLIGHDVDYGVSEHAFTVVRKRSADDPAATQLRDLVRMALGVLDAIEDDGDLDVVVDRSQFTLTALDRRLGPPDEVAASLLAEIEPVVTELYGADGAFAAVRDPDPRAAPALEMQAAGPAPHVLDKLGGSRAPGQSPWDISVEELDRLRADAVDHLLLDVREEQEYEIANLGGTLIPLATLPDRLDDLDRAARIVAHCRSGRRGAKAVAQLRDAGFEDAWNLHGGLVAWSERVDPSLPRY